MIVLALHFLLLGNLDKEIAKTNIKVDQLKELHDQEIGALSELKLEFYPTEKEFYACVPQDSISFPKSLPANLHEQIFTKEEMDALMTCTVADCKFNFLPAEIPALEKAGSPAERQTLFFKFLKDRIEGLKGTDPNRSSLFLRSRDHAFEDCEGPEYQKLLNERPVKDYPFRLAVVKYNKQMRPTTRLLQSASWKNQGAMCFADALVFSDHYDVDWVEVWSLKNNAGTNTLKYQLRHRVDLLNTWVRRLNKNKFRNQAREIAFNQMKTVVACLENQRKPKPAGGKIALPIQTTKPK